MENIYRILVPTDFSGTADRALEAGINLSKLSGAELDLLHIEDVPPDWVDIVEKAERNHYLSINQRLDQVRDHLAERAQRVKNASVVLRDFLEFSKGYRAILGHTENYENDLIVMGAHGIRGLQGLMIGSYTQKVLQTSTLPVLVIKKDNSPFWPRKMVFVSDFDNQHKERFLVAADFAERMGLELHLLLINTPMLFRSTRETEQRMKAYEALAPKGLITKVGTYNEMQFEDGLKGYCVENDIDMVSVLNYRKRHAWRALGSSIQGLINHLNLPILAIPEH